MKTTEERMQTAEQNRTRLQLDGVNQAIVADINSRRANGMVVSQALPFLKLDTIVTNDDGQRARISRVTIAMDRGTPRLLLELLDEEGDDPAAGKGLKLPSAVEPTPAAEVGRPDDTLRDLMIGVSTGPVRSDGTIPYGLDRSVPVRSSDQMSAQMPTELASPGKASRSGFFGKLWVRAINFVMDLADPQDRALSNQPK